MNKEEFFKQYKYRIADIIREDCMYCHGSGYDEQIGYDEWAECEYCGRPMREILFLELENDKDNI